MQFGSIKQMFPVDEFPGNKWTRISHNDAEVDLCFVHSELLHNYFKNWRIGILIRQTVLHRRKLELSYTNSHEVYRHHSGCI